MTQARGKSEPVVALSPELVGRYDVSEPLIEELYKRTTRQQTLQAMQLLWDRRRFLARAAALGLLLFTVGAFLIPKRYESTTRLMPPDSQQNPGLSMLTALSSGGQGGRLGGLGAMAGDMLGLKTSGGLFVGILSSSTVEDDIIRKFELQKIYGARTIESARRALAAKTGVSEDRKSGIITITVVDHSPDRAAAMAQEYAVELNLVMNQLNTSASHRERVFLEERLQQVKQDLEAAEKDFGEFASKNTAIDIKEQGKAMVEAAATLQGHLIAAQSELEGLKQIYTENNIRVRSLRARIAELHKQLGDMGGDSGTTADMPESNSLYPPIRKLPLLGVSYADLYRRTKVQEAIFETLTQQYELAKVSEAKETPSVKVLDPADVPQEKSFPPRLLIMMSGAFLAFVLASIYLLVLAKWRRVNERDPWKMFARQILASLRASRARLLQQVRGRFNGEAAQ